MQAQDQGQGETAPQGPAVAYRNGPPGRPRRKLPQPPTTRTYTAACHDDADPSRVLTLNGCTHRYTTFDAEAYAAWRVDSASGGTRVVAEAPFLPGCDVHLPGASTQASWVADRLTQWWFARHRTGLSTAHERLEALVAYAGEHEL
jgi:hypothetical protein